MSPRPCPQCGAMLLDQARFCGQCGATIEAPNVHERGTTTDRPHDGGAGVKTLFDAAPFGASDPPPRSVPTPVVPANITPAAGSAAHGAHPAAVANLSQTLADPESAARARDAALLAATAETAPTAPPVGAPGAKANLGKTMLMAGGAFSAPSPPVAAPVPPPAEPPPTAHVEAPARPEASPLSRSVLAPGSWAPPAPPPPPPPPPAPAAEAAAAPNAAAPLPRPAPCTAPCSGCRPAIAPTPAAAPHVAPPVAAQMPPAQKTMMGVAIPGIAPLATGGAAHGGAPIDLRSKQGTMMGVAIPGIAPVHPHERAPQPRIPSQVQHTALGIAAPMVSLVPPPGAAARRAPPRRAPAPGEARRSLPLRS